MAQPEPLKAYEREILRARSRVQVADLDNEIDALIKAIIGKLTTAEHKRYQAARLSELMDDTPESIIFRRALLLGLTVQEMKRGYGNDSCAAGPFVHNAEKIANFWTANDPCGSRKSTVLRQKRLKKSSPKPISALLWTNGPAAHESLPYPHSSLPSDSLPTFHTAVLTSAYPSAFPTALAF